MHVPITPILTQRPGRRTCSRIFRIGPLLWRHRSATTPGRAPAGMGNAPGRNQKTASRTPQPANPSATRRQPKKGLELALILLGQLQSRHHRL